ncbi:MAG: ketoacyl-ACP synthase III [Bacteroidota bacterium]
MANAVIQSTGMFVPEKVVPNAYFNELLGTDVDTWLKENVEIYERHWCTEEEATADLCVGAAKVALERAGLTAEDLNLIIIATDTPEFISPSTASVVQDRLGAVNAGSFDLNTACAGFVTALDVGSKYIRSDDQYKHVLVIGAYAMSKYLNLHDKKTVTLFADGAGAVILSAKEGNESGFLASKLQTQGQYNGWMGIYGGGTRIPIGEKSLQNQDQLLKFVKKFPPELNPQMWSEMVKELCERIGAKPEDVDQFFFTQININSIRETLDILGIPHEKAHTVMHHYGYTGSACIPMALDEAVSQGKVNKGDLIMMIGSGGGLAFAGAAFRW